MIVWSALLLLLPFISAFPLDRRATQTACGKFDEIPCGSYSLLTNHWGEGETSDGKQCATLEFVSKSRVSWSTEYSWWNTENGIMSFTNVQLNEGLDSPLNSITSMPTTWVWSLKSDGYIVCNVAYDLFIGIPDGNILEIMIWLGVFNASPISDMYDPSGQPLPVATGISLAGHSWNLYHGSNGHNYVFSFLPADGNITDFRADIFKFILRLITMGYISASDYLKTAQAGTEVTYGTATFKTLTYSLAIH